jgi:tRNA-Thr(GGU) m(6)t(6)A37 methyltransferase TsaA
MEKIIKPIGIIENDFNEKFGLPRQALKAPSLISKITFLPEYAVESAFRELENFSHIWVLFDFSLVDNKKFSPTVRPPRLGGNKKVGVFASRSPFRPNGIGLSLVKLVKIERDSENKVSLIVSGADIVSGTPVYDIKPYVKHSDCVSSAVCGYADMMKYYTVKVEIPDQLLAKIPEEKRLALIECLENDPRPSYQEDGREYGMTYAGLNVKFKVSKNTLTVIDIE